MNNLKIICTIILIIYILLLINIYKTTFNNYEKFTDFLDNISKMVDNKFDIIPEKLNQLKNNQQPLKKEENIKFIYLNEIKNAKEKDKKIKYYLYDKYNDFYMKIEGNFNELNKEIKIKDIKEKEIGYFINEKYTILKFKLDFYNKIANIEYINNYKSVKIYLDNDDKIFYIIFKNNKYYIYLFNNLEIGLIKKDKHKNIFKINIYEEYKNYLNLLALGMVILLNN